MNEQSVNDSSGSISRHLISLLGDDVVLLPIPKGMKGPRWPGWQKFTAEKMKDPDYVRCLDRAYAISVSMGEPSGGLCSIDIDDDESVEPFLALNPKLCEIQTRRFVRKTDDIHRDGPADLLQRAYDLAFDPEAEPPADELCMNLGEYPIAARGNLTCIQGKSKVGKSSVVAATIDGATFSAADANDLMTQLRQDSFNPEADLPSYCRATARASKMQTGKPHRPWPPKALVEDMLASGLIATGKCHPEWGTTND